MFSRRSPGVTTVSNGVVTEISHAKAQRELLGARQALRLCVRNILGVRSPRSPLPLERMEILFELPLKLAFFVIA
jgi:hypothetical protein